MNEIPRSSRARSARLMGLPLGLAGKAARGASQRAMGRSREQVNQKFAEEAAEQVFAVLGELKGGAMKVGQMLSVFEAGMPEEYAEPFRAALTKLQAEAPPMPSNQVHAMLDEQLGTQWRSRVQEFDETPAAAASIGQVHKATWADGRAVAIKVQYPGADEALLSDLRQLRRLAPLFRPFSPATDIKAVIDELYERSVDELDYRIEADHQRVFHEAYADVEEIIVPAVLASSPKVIVSEWVEGVPLSRVASSGTQEERNLAARLLTQFQFSAPIIAKKLHTDPHPGNFLLAPTGQLIALDFGAAIDLPTGFPAPLREMMRLALLGRSDDLVDLMSSIGYLPSGSKAMLSAADASAFVEPFVAPLRFDSFHFNRKWLQSIVAQYGDIRGQEFKTSRGFSMPRDYVMIHRVLGSSAAILCQLDAEAPYRSLINRWLPEIFDADTPIV